MDLILLGAGASFGSGPVHPYAPPIGAKLFDHLEAEYPTWANLPPEAKAEFRRNGLFEPGFDYVRRHHDRMTCELLVEMADYFCRFELRSGNHYSILAAKVRDDDILATTNYDFLCELAVNETGRPISYIPRISGAQVLLKLHGSPNFIPDTRGVLVNCTFEGFAVHFDGPCVPLDLSQTINYLRGRPSLAPAISLYSHGKQVLYAPKTIGVIQSRFVEELTRADRVFVVGLGPALHDEHIWGPLSSTSATIYYVNPSSTHIQSVQEWARQKTMSVSAQTHGFERFVAQYPHY